MTTLAARPVDNPDELALFADNWTSLGKPFADAFHDACKQEAAVTGSFDGGIPHGPCGWVNPSWVRLLLLDHPDYEPRQYAALWSTACARDGYLDKTLRQVPIVGEGSKGNTNKNTFWRCWRVGGGDRG